MAFSAADTSGTWSIGQSSTTPFGLCSAGDSSFPLGPLPDAWPWAGGLGGGPGGPFPGLRGAPLGGPGS
eukprot:11346073-Heterocapsa_arctica.AAC.1